MERQLTIRVVFDKGQADPKIQKTNNSLKAMTGSVADLKNRLQQAEARLLSMTKTSTNYEKVTRRVTNLQNHLSREIGMSNRNMVNTTRGSANMTMAMQSMNFTIRDSPYFFRSFSLGVLAIGNNLNPLIDSLIAVNKEAKSLGSSFRKEMFKALKGSGGVIFAFSILVSVLQAVVFWMENTARETKKAKEELKSYRDEILAFSKATLEANLIKKETELNDLMSKIAEKNYKITKEQNTQLNTLKQQIMTLKERLKTVGDIEEAENRISELKKERQTIRNTEIGGGIISPRQLKRLKEITAEIKKLEASIDFSEKKPTKTKKVKDRSSLIGIKARNFEEGALTKAQSKLLQDMKANFMQNGLSWDAETQAWAFTLAMTLDETPKYGSTGKVNAPNKKGHEKIMKDFSEEMKETDQFIDTMSNKIGNSLFQAFIHGKMGADQFLLSLVAIVGQMLIIDGLQWLLNPSKGATGIFSFLGFSQGGVVKASQGYITGGYGTSDHIPAMLRPNEMVINPSQQKELYHMAKGIGTGGSQQRVDVVVSGEVRESKNSFHTRVVKSNKHHSNNRSLGSIGRS